MIPFYTFFYLHGVDFLSILYAILCYIHHEHYSFITVVDCIHIFSTSRCFNYDILVATLVDLFHLTQMLKNDRHSLLTVITSFELIPEFCNLALIWSVILNLIFKLVSTATTILREDIILSDLFIWCFLLIESLH